MSFDDQNRMDGERAEVVMEGRMKSALETVLKTMGGIYERSCIPTDPENATDADFQAGYAVGLKGREDKKLSDPTHPINLEFNRRGRVNDEPFRNWKRGYWVGVYEQMISREKD